ncbi:MAG TPA: response regulator [Pirellulales bacterium]|jgi:DNA-binding response OmpR family regulator
MSSTLVAKSMVASEDGRPNRTVPLPKILCIDDDPAICRSLQIQLQNYAAEVFTASFGSLGYWEALVHQPDIIITDLRMPQGSGDYVVECLKRNPSTRDIPVIVLTGRRDQNLQRYLRGLGIAQYLVKPVSFDELRSELQRFITLLPRADDDLAETSNPEIQLHNQLAQIVEPNG